MQTGSIKVVHFLNQFFAGAGGEDKAHASPQVRDGALGPGKALQNALGERGEVVATVFCGDNYCAERMKEATEQVIKLLTPYRPDAVIAGPAFEAGRYGIACGAVCQAVQNQLGIPAVTGMYKENPGADIYRKDVYIIETGPSAREMTAAVSNMVDLMFKLATRQKIGKPDEEGYFSRGLVINEVSDQTGAERVVSILLNKLRGEPFQSEVPRPKYDRVKPVAGIKDIRSATIALVTDGGLVPRGNPDKIESLSATRFGSYGIRGVTALNAEDYEVKHIGYDSTFVAQDPNRLVPVDVMRDLEKEGAIGKFHETFYATTGVATSVGNATDMGQSIAGQLKAEGVSGVILTSTWGTSTRCGAALVKEMERAGLPAAHICTVTLVALMVGSNRIVPASSIVHPVGNAALEPAAEKSLRRVIVDKALQSLQAEVQEQTLFAWPR